MVECMADEKEPEVEDRRRLRVIPGSRAEREAEPGREAAGQDRRATERDAQAPGIGTTQADRFEQDAREERLRNDGRAQVDVNRPDGELTDDDRRQLRADAAGLRSRAGAERSVARIDDDQAYELREDAAGRDDPAATADERRADWLSADAARNQRNARADEAEADSDAAQAEAAPPPGQVEPSHDRLSPTDGTQAAAHRAVENRPHAPAARRGRTNNQRTPRQREGRDR
jgi:hypothetical protein